MSCEVFIPFPGFYESWISQEMENVVEYELEECPDRNWEDYEFDFRRAAKEYMEVYWFALQDAVDGLPAFLDNFELLEVISPREYNFETDRILVVYLGSRNDLMLIRALTCGIDTLDEDIKRHFKSHDGFISFYDDFATNWKNKPFEKWDANELSILLPEFGWEDLLDDLREPLYDCVIYKGAAT